MLRRPRLIATYPLPLRQMAQECRSELTLELARHGFSTSADPMVRALVVRRVMARRRRPPALPRLISRPGLGAARQAAVERFRLAHGCIPDASCLRIAYCFRRVLPDYIGRRLAALGVSPLAIREILLIVGKHRRDYAVHLQTTLPVVVITDPAVMVWRVTAELCRARVHPSVHTPVPEADWTAPIRAAVERG